MSGGAGGGGAAGGTADPGFTRTVYARVWPETRAVVDELWGERPHHLYEDASSGWQDPLGSELVERWTRWVSPVVELAAERYPARYATAGSTEAIRETLAQHAVREHAAGRSPRIHVFEGEYEGYEAQAAGYGIDTVKHPRDLDASTFLSGPGAARHGDRVYVSAPSAIDGDLWDGFEGWMEVLAEQVPWLPVTVDLAYVGLVPEPFRLDLDRPNVDTVFFSLSKPFGVYYHRIGGVLSRTELPGLFGTKWFKNLFSIELGNRLLDRFGVTALPARHREEQRALLEDLSARLGVPLRPSDVVLLATADPDDGLPDWTADYLRTSDPDARPRFCLTRLLEARGA